jgi:transposase
MEAAPNRRSSIRLNAIRPLLLGVPRKTVCEIFCRTDRSIRLWIELFNRGGIDALITRVKPGRPRKVKLQRVRDILVPILDNPKEARQVHWTGVKLHGYLKDKLKIDLGYSSVVRWIHELDYHLRVPRRWSVKQDQDARKAFVKELETLCAEPNTRIWFQDESGVEGDPRPRRRWVKPGIPRKVPYRGDHIRQSIVGAVEPESGQLFSLIVDGVDTDVFQLFLDQLAQASCKEEGVRQVMIMDNASWHKTTRLNWHHFEPKYLPAYSPDFNPIERLWLRLKADWFSDFIAQTSEELVEQISKGLQSFISNPEKTGSICAIRK